MEKRRLKALVDKKEELLKQKPLLVRPDVRDASTQVNLLEMIDEENSSDIEESDSEESDSEESKSVPESERD